MEVHRQRHNKKNATIIIDASEFFDTIPKGDTIEDAGTLRTDWVFNNDSICLRTKEEPFAGVRIPQPGAYHLFVRSQGTAGESFKVAVNGKTSSLGFGDAPVSWKYGGVFELGDGSAEVRLVDIRPAPCLDVIVLTKNKNFRVDELPRQQLPAEVELLKEYKIPDSLALKFGDVTGDGRAGFMVLTPGFSAHVYDHGGKELWAYQAPQEGACDRTHEPPGSIFDLDRDGFAEVVHWRFLDGKEWLVVADGRTGKIKHRVEWPLPLPHAYNNFRTAIGKLTTGYPNNIIVFTDSGGIISIHAYSYDLKLLWSHTENRLKDHLGHYPYPADLNGDGIDEVVVSPFVLDATGKMLWNRFDLFSDNHDHADSFKFADINGDGQVEILTPFSNVGVLVFKALTGELLWQHPTTHAQQLEVGSFLKGVAGPQVVVGARTYGNRKKGEPYLSSQIYWFDPKGILLSKWPANPLNGNPDFVKGDWKGEGKEELFWYKFKLNDEGKGVLYFEEPVYHMFDFMGLGREEVVTLGGGMLKVYGYKFAKNCKRKVKRDPEYLRHKVANHTHY